MATVSQWVEGARLRTLPLAVAPIIAGSAAAYEVDSLHAGRALLAFLVAFFLQVGVNYANDYSDGIKGTDEVRVGPLRLVGSGVASPRSVKFAAFACFALAMLCGLWLVALAHQWWFLAIGASSVFAAWGYTGGKRPYGYMGLGDIFVFIYFGLVATLGTLYTQAAQLTLTGWVLAIGLGLISCAMLMANNVRDIPTDIDAGKFTLAVRLGDKNARRAYALEMVIALLLVALLLPHNPWYLLLFILVAPVMHSCVVVLSGSNGPALIPVLKQAGIIALVFAILAFVAVYLDVFEMFADADIAPYSIGD
ncbi:MULTISPECIES: 1,4-dihydroxy-2-naphthoate polyprenyltransferase [unclassified Rothia (in: high G+C Gram-positive bacteria)]|uniref:1,4-dihydroxy-2-naphthoate polyprenyltransferase n=1 Tax=unclassified Rothia (in: high G+C Gram-positive bacteria) TaxID=2689056 RepID=UPI00195E2862|nr:1,4-dihydroxy-2-naphthoate polyprenyltransferase [Rothia sp. ZJ932]MBM7051937.1 1,4-dihydroxy-2-naphthoate polyprenyltransferase [Rothia sp. ZJ1223]QRZ61994.1 1,4-dihydroxy-2-naphthoate polyprenyltransferase [Rothia sp. ZJ932]